MDNMQPTKTTFGAPSFRRRTPLKIKILFAALTVIFASIDTWAYATELLPLKAKIEILLISGIVMKGAAILAPFFGVKKLR